MQDAYIFFVAALTAAIQGNWPAAIVAVLLGVAPLMVLWVIGSVIRMAFSWLFFGK